REQLSPEERRKLLDGLKREGILSESKRGKGRKKIGRTAGWAAAAAVFMLVIVPNISAEAAYAMEQIPVLGGVISAVTIRNYRYESEQFSADIREVKLEQGDEAGGVSTDDIGTEEAGQETAKMEGSIQTINHSIEEMTDRLIARFEEQVDLGEGHGSINVDHEVVTDTDTWFTLRIDVTEIAGSGFQYQYYYHIDKATGEIASLKHLFKEGADYITPISENIKEQMRAQMRADESKIYWVDSEEEMGEQFEAIKDDQNFYLNKEGRLVICFDEYEVAPGYMGLVEFAVEEEAIAEIRK
ncbi:MAG: RsiV family protein, partial [Lachnospiraceae bacterium]|nr:RsiV family protein [Lachnospiraceae bacterium]